MKFTQRVQEGKIKIEEAIILEEAVDKGEAVMKVKEERTRLTMNGMLVC